MTAVLAPIGRVIDARILMARRTISSTIITAVLGPLLFLLGMGQGVGAVVDPDVASSLAGGSYLAFLAPGLMVASAMQLSAGESLWPVMVGLEWRKTYHAAVATRLSPVHLVLGNLSFTALRAAFAGTIVAMVIALMGAAEWWRILAVVPVSALIGLSFGGLVTAFTATVRSGDAMTTLFRFAILPLFLFSGTFFPVDRFPEVVQHIVALSPLFHAAELARGIALGTDTAWHPSAHLAVLVVIAVIGALLSIKKVAEVLRR